MCKMHSAARSITGVALPTLLVLALCGLLSAVEPTVDELKARFNSTSIQDRPHLCVQIAKQQEAATDKLYAANDFEKAQAALEDVVTYSELARDYAIQSHKYQKQAEIAVREFVRKLGDLKRSLPKEDQSAVSDAITRLQHVRDDLLTAMFPKGAK
jgi:hypothetical protein